MHNQFHIRADGIAEIELTQGKVTLINAEDIDKVAQFSGWYANRARNRIWVAVSSNPEARTKMSRVILDAPDDMEVDHRNHNTLDNRRDNLRLVSHSENLMNRRKWRGCSSEYKGVSWEEKYQKWRARISLDGKLTHLGYFEDETEAAMAYNEAAVQHYGPLVYLNRLDG